MSDTPQSAQQNRYSRIIEWIFLAPYREGDRVVPFERQEIDQAAAALGVERVKNVGDLMYSFRYRNELPQASRG